MLFNRSYESTPQFMYVYSTLDYKSSQNAFLSLLNSISITIIHQIKTFTTVDKVARNTHHVVIIQLIILITTIGKHFSLYFLNMWLIKNI